MKSPKHHPKASSSRSEASGSESRSGRAKPVGLQRGRWLGPGILTLILLVAAEGPVFAQDGVDVFTLNDSLSLGVRLAAYGLVGLGLCLVSLAVPDAPLLVYIFSMSVVEFAGLGVALMLMQCAIVLLKTGRPRMLVPSWVLSLFLICIVASGSWALDPRESLSAPYTGIVATLLQVPLTLACLASLRCKLTTVRRVLGALVLGAVPGAIRTIQNALAGIRYSGDQGMYTDNEYYMGFIAPDTFSTILVMGAIFLAYSLTCTGAGVSRRAMAGLLLLLLSVALLLSGIRSGWIGAGLGTLMVLARARSWLALAPVGLMLLLLGILSFSSIGGLKINEKMSARLSESSMDSGQARLAFWKVAVRGFAQGPVLGIGWGCFPGFAAGSTIGKPVATHNVFVRVLCELGLVGFAILAIWMVTTFAKAGGSSAGGLVRPMMLAVLVQSFFLDQFLCTHFWLFLGLCEGIRTRQPEAVGRPWELPPGLREAQSMPSRP